MSSTNTILPPALSRLRTLTLIGAPVGLVGAILLSLVTGNKLDAFFEAYLFSFLICWGLSVGSLAFIMIHHMTAGAWSFVTQRILEASTRVLPILLLLFLPILLGPLAGLNNLYSAWADPEQVSELVESKAFYLNPGFWAVRAFIYFAIWGALTYLMNAWSKQLDETNDPLITLKFRRLAPPGLMIYCVTIMFAATDWAMSLEPEWFSTIYGPLTWISHGLTVLAFITIMLSYLAEQKPLSTYVKVEHYHHLGNLTLGFTVLWAYMSFSQYLITWSGNLPEETLWYLARRGGGLTALSIILMIFHFAVPMFLLLFRRNKLRISVLRRICFYILLMRLLDVFWNINPAFHHESPGIYFSEVLIHIAALVGVASVWLWFFLGELQKRPLLPLNDPRLYEAVGPRQEEALENA